MNGSFGVREYHRFDGANKPTPECQVPHDVGPGRIYSPDPDDRKYLVDDQVIRMLADRHKDQKDAGAGKDRAGWKTGPILDQGETSMCVGFSWKQFLASAPVMTRDRTLPSPQDLYKLAQKNDEWPGENYSGSSVRGGAKALVSLGLITEYRWSANIDQFKEWINSAGPAVIGIDWFEEMFRPRGGFVIPGGKKAGGHAIMVDDYSPVKKAFRLVNSWGREWGENGRAWVDEEDFNYLVFQLNGEACHAVEKV